MRPGKAWRISAGRHVDVHRAVACRNPSTTARSAALRGLVELPLRERSPRITVDGCANLADQGTGAAPVRPTWCEGTRNALRQAASPDQAFLCVASGNTVSAFPAWVSLRVAVQVRTARGASAFGLFWSWRRGSSTRLARLPFRLRIRVHRVRRARVGIVIGGTAIAATRPGVGSGVAPLSGAGVVARGAQRPFLDIADRVEIAGAVRRGARWRRR